MGLTDIQIRSLIDTNQTAIKQLGEDILKLNQRMEEQWMERDNAMKMMQRDISDRWQMISDMNKKMEKIIDELKIKD
jgi:hypothetical protein